MSGESNFNSRMNLDQLLADPLIRLVMQADHVDAAQVRQVFESVRPRQPMTPAERTTADGDVAICPHRAADCRSGVGIMLINADGEVFVGQRIDVSDEAWQMPQGGIEKEEEPLAAALRELREEIGTDHVEVLAESRGWLRYDLPDDLVGKGWGAPWRGQQQKWFAMRFLGADADINIATEHPEFSAWRWIPSSHLPKLIVQFKRQLYMDILSEFQGIQLTGGR